MCECGTDPFYRFLRVENLYKFQLSMDFLKLTNRNDLNNVGNEIDFIIDAKKSIYNAPICVL